MLAAEVTNKRCLALAVDPQRAFHRQLIMDGVVKLAGQYRRETAGGNTRVHTLILAVFNNLSITLVSALYMQEQCRLHVELSGRGKDMVKKDEYLKKVRINVR